MALDHQATLTEHRTAAVVGQLVPWRRSSPGTGESALRGAQLSWEPAGTWCRCGTRKVVLPAQAVPRPETSPAAGMSAPAQLAVGRDPREGHVAGKVLASSLVVASCTWPAARSLQLLMGGLLR